MRIWVATAMLAVSVCRFVSAQSGPMTALSTPLRIEGVAAGGTVTLGVTDGGPETTLTVQTVAGESAADVAAKLAAATPPQEWGYHLSVQPDGVTLDVLGAMPFSLYLRSTDPGMVSVGAVTNLRAKPSRANGNIVLTWNAATPTPDVIRIFRNGETLAQIAGTDTSFIDNGTIVPRPHDTPPPAGGRYTLICGSKGPSGKIVKFSDVAYVHSERPSQLEDDAFRIVSTQEDFDLGAVQGLLFEEYVLKNAGTNPVVWSLTGGQLPAGLTLTNRPTSFGPSPTGLIAGTPTETGIFSFTVRVTDATGLFSTASFTIAVTEFPLLDE
jgi:hypothetical protein